MEDNNNIDIEKMIYEYRDYIRSIIVNNSKGEFNLADIEDAMSDVFLNLWNNKEKIDEVDNIKGYIASITKNVVNDKLRKLNNDIELTEDISDTQYDTEVIHDRIALKEVIEEKLNNLTDEEYEIFSKYYYSSKKIKEIADEMNLSENNVKVKLHRIRKKIKGNSKDYHSFIKHLITVIVIFVLFIFSFILSKEIIKHFIDEPEGVEKAVDNGYISENTDNKENNKNDEVDISINNILMDDFNLCINFDITLNIENYENVMRCTIPNLIITDENDNLIVYKMEDKVHSKLSNVIEFKEENKYRYMGINDGTESMHITNDSGNKFTLSYITHSTEFPKSKKLDILFDEIRLYDYNGEIICTEYGDWMLNTELPEEFFKRSSDIYVLESSNDENLKVTKAVLTNTGFRLEFETKWGTMYYDENDSEEEKLRKVKQVHDEVLYFEYVLENSISPLYESYVEDENGNRYYSPGTSDSDGRIFVNDIGKLTYSHLFDYTKYDETNRIKVVIEKDEHYFDVSKDKYLVIELVREK